MLGLAIPVNVQARAIPAAPTQTHVLDQANIIDDTTEATITDTLFDYEAKTGNQIAILTVPSLDGEDLFDYTQRVATAWGVGDAEVNNGVLLLVAVEDRKLRIHVGRGLEPYLTDLQSSRIIDQKITPAFKKNDYSGGVQAGVDSMIAVIGGERLSASPDAGSTSSWLGALFEFAPLLFVPLVYLGSYLARTRSWWVGGVLGGVPGGIMISNTSKVFGGIAVMLGGIGVGLLLDYMLSKNYRARAASGAATSWWGSGGGFFGGSGGSGGGSSFGGGSFGGGGSSGSW